MSKEEILKEAAVKYYETMGLPENMAINAASELINNPSYKFTLTAMQTYAEQQAQGEYDRGVADGNKGAKEYNEQLEAYENQLKEKVKELDETLAKYKDLIQNTEQQSVEFAEWIEKLQRERHIGYIADWEKWRIWPTCSFHVLENDLLTTSQLFKIWKDETGK